MKRIITLTSFLVLFAISNVSFAQTDLADCTDYPTADETLNGYVRSFVRHMNEFNSKMTSIYSRLVIEEQQLVNTYLSNSDRNLFRDFPQFEDVDLQNEVGSLKNDYTLALARFRELFPNAGNDEQVQKTNQIIKCCAVKNISEQLGLNRIDPCTFDRKDCLLSVTAQASLMHLGCAAADLTIFLGIICHGLAFTYQYAEFNKCESAYKKCKEGN